MFLVYLFFGLFLIFKDIEASGTAQLSDMSLEGEIPRIQNNNNDNSKSLRDFFKSAKCQTRQYHPESFLKRISSSGKSKEDLRVFKACFIDISRLKEEKKMILKYIKDPKNWAQDRIEKNLYKSYHSFLNRKIIIKEKHLIIYSFVRELIEIIGDKNYCILLDPNEIQKIEASKKLGEGQLIKRGCLIRLKDDRFKEKEITEYYKELLHGSKSAQKAILSYIGQSDGTDFSSWDRLFLKTEYSDGYFKIALSELTEDKSEVFNYNVLNPIASCIRLFESDLLMLESDPRFPAGQLVNTGCWVSMGDHRFMPKGSLFEFKKESLIDNFFKDKEKKQHLLKALQLNTKKKPLLKEIESSSRSIEDIHFLTRIKNNASGEYIIYIFTSTQDKKKALESQIFRELKRARPERAQISASQIGSGYLLKDFYVFKMTDARMKKGGSLEDYYNAESLNERFNEAQFKKGFIDKFNKILAQRARQGKPAKKFNAERSKIEVKTTDPSKGELEIYLIERLSEDEEVKSIILQAKKEGEERKCYTLDDEDELKEQAIELLNQKYKDKYLNRACLLFVRDDRFGEGGSLRHIFEVNKLTDLVEADPNLKNQILDGMAVSFKELDPEKSSLHISIETWKDDEFVLFVLERTSNKNEALESLLFDGLEYKDLLEKDRVIDEIPKGEDFNRGFIFYLSDPRLEKGGSLRELFNTETLKGILSNPLFKKSLIDTIKKMDNIQLNFSKTKIKIEIPDQESGSFNVMIFDTKPNPS